MVTHSQPEIFARALLSIAFYKARVDTRWIDPNYGHPHWDNKTFLEEYAERLDVFAHTIGILLIYCFEDWHARFSVKGVLN